MPTSDHGPLFDVLTTGIGPLGTRVLGRLRAEIPAYADRSEADLLPAVDTSLRWVLAPLSDGRGFTADELAAFRSYGQERARQGISAQEMLHAWRLSVREFVDELVDVGRRLAVADAALLDLTRDVLATSDAAILAFVDGHRLAELELVRHEQNRRADFVRGVLLATWSTTDIRQQAQRYGLDPDRGYRPVRVRPTAAAPAADVERLLGCDFPRDRPRGMTALVDGDVAGFVAALPDGDVDVALGVAAAAPLSGLAPNFQRATRALVTAVSFGLTGTYDLGRLGLLPAVLADADVSAELHRRYVEPVGVGGAAESIVDTVRRYLVAGMRADVVAAEMAVHHNTVRYRVRRYEELTGIDLRDPNRGLEAWWALQRPTISADRPASAG